MNRICRAVLILAGSLSASLGANQALAAPEAVNIAVFQFELEDSSAGGGIIARDARDDAYLADATEMARTSDGQHFFN